MTTEHATLPAPDNSLSTADDKKSASAFRTIGEAAEIIGVAQHVLRFWESKIKQISPLKRRGRRYYRPEDIDVLKQIKTLLYTEGYTVRGVQKSLEDAAKSKPKQCDLFESRNTVVHHNTPSNAELDALHAMDALNDAKLEKLGEILTILIQSRNRLAAFLQQ